jgi:hypothetical protein
MTFSVVFTSANVLFYFKSVNKDRLRRARRMWPLMSLSLTLIFRRLVIAIRNVHRRLCADFKVSAELIDS